jgi:hypothetical protein
MLSEIKFVSSQLRASLKSKSHKSIPAESLERQAGKNFWKTCKKVFDDSIATMPNFGLDKCFEYFKNILQKSPGVGGYKIPKWIPALPSPVVDFDDSPPTYQAVTRAIDFDDSPSTYQAVTRALNKCRPSASSSPMDQMPVVAMKKCPIIRTTLHRYTKSVC